MAGIGFELKKLFSRKGVFNTLRGVAYSALTTVGPTFLVIMTIICINIVFNYNALPYPERDLLSSGLLYVFIFSLIVTSPYTAVLSRYIADKIFEKDFSAIMPSYYIGLMLCSVTGALMAIPFSLWGIFVGKIDAMFMLLMYFLFLQMCMVFLTMSYINILKEYNRVAMAFVFGMLITFFVTALLYKYFGISLTMSMAYAFNVGYLFIAFRLYTLLRLFIPQRKSGYAQVFRYFARHKALFAANLFYVIGLYMHNFVFWGSHLRVVVSDTFIIAPTYDLASCFAMFTNISFMVAFVVQIETSFYDKYNAYCHMLVGGNKKDIDKAKRLMFNALSENLITVIKTQALFTFCFILVSYILFPIIGTGGMIASIYPTMAVAYITVFVSYSFVVMLYYFDDEPYAMLSTFVFAAGTFAGAMFARQLAPELYGIGVFIGALCGFSVSVLRLSYLYNHLDRHIFCRGHIVKPVMLKRYHDKERKRGIYA